MDNFYNFLSKYKLVFTIVHVLGVVVGMGAALVLDFLFSFYAHNKKLSHSETYTLRILSNVIWNGLIIITISGIGLFLSDIETYIVSTKFLAKMSILFILILNGYILHRYISKSMVKKGFLSFPKYTWIRKLAFACGATSVVSWLSILSLGVVDNIYMSYGTIIGLYGIILIGSIILSLIIEKNSFENKKDNL